MPKPFLRHGRSEMIRTSGPCLPKTVLYQAELHSDTLDRPYLAAFFKATASRRGRVYTGKIAPALFHFLQGAVPEDALLVASAPGGRGRRRGGRARAGGGAGRRARASRK